MNSGSATEGSWYSYSKEYSSNKIVKQLVRPSDREQPKEDIINKSGTSIANSSQKPPVGSTHSVFKGSPPKLPTEDNFKKGVKSKILNLVFLSKATPKQKDDLVKEVDLVLDKFYEEFIELLDFSKYDYTSIQKDIAKMIVREAKTGIYESKVEDKILEKVNLIQ